MKPSLFPSKNNKKSSAQRKKFHFYDAKEDTTVSYSVTKEDNAKTSFEAHSLPNLEVNVERKARVTHVPAYQANAKKSSTDKTSSKFIPPFLKNNNSNKSTRSSTSLFSSFQSQIEMTKKSKNVTSGNSKTKTNTISNFFIKPNNKNTNNDDDDDIIPISNKTKEKKDVKKKGFSSPFFNPSRRNEIPVGKATILRGSDVENSTAHQSSSHRYSRSHGDGALIEDENLELNSLKEDKENVIPSKRTFSEFDDIDYSDQETELKRQKTAESDSDDDYDDELIGNLFNCDDDDFNHQHTEEYNENNNDEYAKKPEADDFDFNVPSPQSPEYLSPNNSPPHFIDDVESNINQEDFDTQHKNCIQEKQTQPVESEILPVDDLPSKTVNSQATTDELELTFEKSSAEYLSVLEELADTLKTLDNEFLQNILGEEKFQVYKKRQIERNRLRAEKRRLRGKINQSRLSINSQIRSGSLLQNNTFSSYSHSTLSTSTFPPCGESFHHKSPPISQKNSFLISGKDVDNKPRNSGLEGAQNNSSYTTPVLSSRQTTTQSFEDENFIDFIDIDNDDNPPYYSGSDLTKSSTPITFDSRRCDETTLGTNKNSISSIRNVKSNEGFANEGSCISGPRKTPPKKIGNSLPDDGYRSEFKRTDYAFSSDMSKALRQTFGLKCFRSNQREAITAVLLNKDCFILMPTGGGKSLCYQLPAIISPGVTIVVSPLKSLIQDQVMKLVSNHIPAFQMTGDTSEGVISGIYRDLHSSVPETKLLYVTPEKLSSSGKLLSALQNLYQRKKLSRFVIDEAHCVSQWGHDFRPDYKKLSALKEKFPLVPLMALTATATPRVRKDIVTQLRMKSPMWFSQSFDRPNLQFLLRPKKGKVVEQITESIKSSHANDSGIIYCLSRNECDKLAGDLRQTGIQAISYHAGLSDPERARVQEDWIRDRCKVICATIAFGMGIDKADVRFVFHYSLPKSLEGYFQECGRAGRDGQNSVCLLFYNYSDVYRLKRMVLSDKTKNKTSTDVHMNNLYRVVQYCENQTECRRAQLLEYFGETGFDRASCRENEATICDNCSSADAMVEMNVTQPAKLIVESVNTLIHKGNSSWRRPMAQLTLKHLVDVFKGSHNAKVERESLHKCVMYGKADENFHRNEAERLFRMLVMQDILAEDLTEGTHSQVISYAKLGPKAMDFLNGRVKLPPFFKRGKKSSKRGTDNQRDASNNSHVTNTCYQQLVSCCKRLAEEHKMKPEHIFADVTLRQMAEKLPMTREEMLDIEGVTEYKMDKFGQEFLELTLTYGGALLTSDVATTSDTDFMADSDRMEDTSECESPYWASSDNFTAAANKKSNKRKGKRNWGKKKFNYQTKSRSKNTFKKADPPSNNTNSYINNPIVNKYKNFSKNRNLGTGRAPGFVSLPPRKKL